MATETFYPAAETDDGTSASDASFNTSWEYCAFGLWYDAGPTTRDSFFRFPNITIDQGSTITTCLLKVYGVATNPFLPRAGSTLLNVYFVDEDNPDAPTSCDEYNALSVTDAVEWEEDSDWVTDTLYESPELKTILQSVVDRGGFSSGNSVIVLVKDNGSALSAWQNCRSYDYDSGSKKAELYIEWEAGSSSEEVTAEPLIAVGSLSALVTGNNVQVITPSFIAQGTLEASILYQAINTRVPWIDDNKGNGPWDFIPSKDKLFYNEGDRISSIVKPIWDLAHNFSGIPTTEKHNPCGYWSKFTDGYSPTPTPPYSPITTYDKWTSGAGSYAPYSYSLVTLNGKYYIGSQECKLIEYNGTDFTSDYVSGQPPGTNAGHRITDMIVFNNKIYAVRTRGGTLCEWNGVDDWVVKVDAAYAGFSTLYLAVYNGILYAIDTYWDRLLRWDGESSWVIVATYEGGAGSWVLTGSILASSGIFLGGQNNEELYQWDGDELLVKVASGEDNLDLLSLEYHTGAIYAGTNAGTLLRRSGDSWTQVAPIYENELLIRCLLSAEGRLFASTGREAGETSGGGKLLEYDENIKWIERTGSVTQDLMNIVVNNYRIYGQTCYPSTKLVRWGDE